jgi:hypothetical protein
MKYFVLKLTGFYSSFDCEVIKDAVNSNDLGVTCDYNINHNKDYILERNRLIFNKKGSLMVNS